MTLHRWKKIGKPKTLVSHRGKKMIMQKFENPLSRRVENFYLYGETEGAIVLPLDMQKHVIYVKQYKHGCHTIVSELPAGAREYKEKPVQAMKRELLEETGYSAKKIIPLGFLYLSSRSSWVRYHAFLALGCEKKHEPKQDVDEEIEVCAVSLKKWIQMIYNGTIKNPPSIVATFLSFPHLGIGLKF